MRLYALRHGKAGDGYPDASRELTERGRNDVADTVSSRAVDLQSIELLVHSPLVRAQQTADIVLRSLRGSPRVEESDLVTPGAEVEDFLAYLAGCSGDLMICTHNPFVAELVSFLTGKLTNMPTAALAALEFDVPARGRARLLWLDTP